MSRPTSLKNARDEAILLPDRLHTFNPCLQSRHDKELLEWSFFLTPDEAEKYKDDPQQQQKIGTSARRIWLIDHVPLYGKS